jgi:hypothetical protein
MEPELSLRPRYVDSARRSPECMSIAHGSVSFATVRAKMALEDSVEYARNMYEATPIRWSW